VTGNPARGWQWIKYKRDYQSDLKDTLDLVVIGGFVGRGKRTGFYGALLMAAWNPRQKRYESVCKLGSGFTDASLAQLREALSPLKLDRISPDIDPGLVPDVFFAPKMVLEVVAAEITLSPVHRAGWGEIRKDSGLAVRFPRFSGRIRTDKGPTDATTVDEITSLYKRQSRVQPPEQK
jgi:DNA ligase 1